MKNITSIKYQKPLYLRQWQALLLILFGSTILHMSLPLSLIQLLLSSQILIVYCILWCCKRGLDFQHFICYIFDASKEFNFYDFILYYIFYTFGQFDFLYFIYIIFFILYLFRMSASIIPQFHLKQYYLEIGESAVHQ